MGEFVDSIGCQVGYMPFDYKRQRWSSAWDWKWRVLPVDPCLLPELVAPGEILGTITDRAARQTGIPAGLPLVAAATDKASQAAPSTCSRTTWVSTTASSPLTDPNRSRYPISDRVARLRAGLLQRSRRVGA